MKREPVNSSSVGSIGYDPVTGVLEIEYRANRYGDAAVWQYPDVTHEQYVGIVAAQSIGVAVSELRFEFKTLGRKVATIDRDGQEFGVDQEDVA